MTSDKPSLQSTCYGKLATTNPIWRKSPKSSNINLPKTSRPITNPRTAGILALLLGVVCWGVTPVILRALTPFIDGWTANGIRYPIAAVLYWPLLFFSFRDGRLNLPLLRRCLVPAMCSLAGQVFWALAFYELPASEIGFLIRLSSVWAVVGSMFLFRDERKLLGKPGFYLGVTLIVGGFLAMSFLRSPTSTDALAESSPAAGNYKLGLLYIILCGAFFGMYLVSVRKCIPDVSPLLSFGVVANIVSIGTIAGMFWKGDVSSIADQTTFSWSLLVASTLLGIAMGHILLFVAVQRLGASITSICQTLMPFVTAGVASVTLSEALNGWQWMSGCVMVSGAIALLSMKHEINRDGT